MSGPEPQANVIERLEASIWMKLAARVAMLAAPAVVTWIGSAGIDAAKAVSRNLDDIKAGMAMYGQRLESAEKKLEDLRGVKTDQAVTSSRLDDVKSQLDKIERIVAETQRRTENRVAPGVSVN